MYGLPKLIPITFLFDARASRKIAAPFSGMPTLFFAPERTRPYRATTTVSASRTAFLAASVCSCIIHCWIGDGMIIPIGQEIQDMEREELCTATGATTYSS